MVCYLQVAISFIPLGLILYEISKAYGNWKRLVDAPPEVRIAFCKLEDIVSRFHFQIDYNIVFLSMSHCSQKFHLFKTSFNINMFWHFLSFLYKRWSLSLLCLIIIRFLGLL